MTVVASIYGHDLSGTTAQRPTNMEAGMTYLDTTLNVLYVQTSNGLKSVSGHISITTVVAAGTNQGTATALQGGGLNNVTGADGTKGVALPANSITDNVLVYNSSASILKVYPAGTNTINGGSASASVNVEPLTLATFIALDGTNWAYDGTSSEDQGAVIADSITGGASPFPIVGQAAQTTTGTGGAISITSGAGGSSSGSAGAITISGGTATSGAGSSVTITGGSGAGGTSAGGNLNLVPGAAVSTGVPGEVQVNGNSATFFQSEALTATDATRTIMVATRPFRLKNVSSVFTTASVSGTLQLEKCTGTTAPGSGTTLLTGTVALSGTANTVASGTLIATVASITFAAGDRLGIVIAGTMTSIVGARITVGLTPV